MIIFYCRCSRRRRPSHCLRLRQHLLPRLSLRPCPRLMLHRPQRLFWLPLLALPLQQWPALQQGLTWHPWPLLRQHLWQGLSWRSRQHLWQGLSWRSQQPHWQRPTQLPQRGLTQHS
jgi:hypothetical protein